MLATSELARGGKEGSKAAARQDMARPSGASDDVEEEAGVLAVVVGKGGGE